MTYTCTTASTKEIPRRRIKTLRDIIRRHVERQTEDKMLLEKEKAVKNVANVFQNLKPSGPPPRRKQVQLERRKRQPLSSLCPIPRDIQAKTEREVLV